MASSFCKSNNYSRSVLAKNRRLCTQLTASTWKIASMFLIFSSVFLNFCFCVSNVCLCVAISSQIPANFSKLNISLVELKLALLCLCRSGVWDDLWVGQSHSGGLPGEPDVSAALLPRHTRHGARPPGRLQGSAPLLRGGRRPQRYGEAVLGICDILVRIRILGSVHLSNGSGCGSGGPQKPTDSDADPEHC